MTQQEWNEWKLMTQTQEWFEYLGKLKEGLKDGWVSNAYVSASGDETLQRNAAAIGQAQLLEDLIDTTYEEIEESE